MNIGEGLFDFEQGGDPTASDLKTAVVLLFVLAATKDKVLIPEELERIVRIMGDHFHQAPEETGRMIELAELCMAEDGTADRLLDRLRNRFSESQREKLALLVQEVVASDGFLCFEEKGFLAVLSRYIG
jgi:uncharacterized tellurite resistance protein B-like protein